MLNVTDYDVIDSEFSIVINEEAIYNEQSWIVQVVPVPIFVEKAKVCEFMLAVPEPTFTM